MQNTNRDGTTLVIGASGKTGRSVTDRHIAQGRRVRPLSRSTEPRFDWQDERTWAPALDGVDAAYITYFPDLALPCAAETVDASLLLLRPFHLSFRSRHSITALTTRWAASATEQQLDLVTTK